MSPRQKVIDNKKQCTKCNEWKILEDFINDPRCTSGKTSRCKECLYISNRHRYKTNESSRKNTNLLNKKSSLKRKYNLSVENWHSMIEAQNNECAICHTFLDKSTSRHHPHVDHNHDTGKVRGILCSLCNVGLGSFKDNIDSLIEAINYLKDRD